MLVLVSGAIVGAGDVVALKSRVAPVVAAVVLVCSCGEQTSELGRKASSEPSAAFDELQGAANRVYAVVHGSRLENDAAGVLQAWALNGAMDGCMAEAGHPEWDWSTARAHGTEPMSGLAASTFFDEPLRLGFALSVIANEGASEREAELMGVEPSGPMSEAIDTCSADPKVGEDKADQLRSVKAVRTMRNRWYSFVSSLDRYGHSVAYLRCLEAADLDVLEETGQPFGELQVALSISYPSQAQDIPESLDAPNTSPAWRHAVELEQQYAQASWDCRGDTYHAHADQVLADVIAFEDKWEAEIDGTAADWRAVVTEAQALGWDPSTNTVHGAAS